MPTFLDDLDVDTAAMAAAPAITPKFFSSELTGAGKKTGLISNAVGPLNNPSNSPTRSIERKNRHTSGYNVTLELPMDPMIQKIALSSRFDVTIPETDHMFHLGQRSINGSTEEVYLNLRVQGMILYLDKTPSAGSREMHVQYRMEIYSIARPTETTASNKLTPGENNLWMEWDYHPLNKVDDFVSRAVSMPVDQQKVAEWMADFPLYDAIVEQAEIWQNDDIGSVICSYIENTVPRAARNPTIVTQIQEQMAYLENYDVSLDVYREIHAAIVKFAPDAQMVEKLSKSNLNLMMGDTLENLHNQRGQLTSPPGLPAGTAFSGRFSPQQREAICTTKPLVLVQAGAGTGKSTVILGRIDYLTQAGVDPKDITVLSFTNAAADNIKAKNPAVGSMTIARMIHDTYSLNHPLHGLSSLDTILNSLTIFYPNHNVATELRRCLFQVKKNEKGAYTKTNTFIEENYDEVIKILDRLQQTSLELEIIICFQRIHTMQEPSHIQSKYLIIDEVQDNSIFEFIYVLKYVAKHAENLYIVGDSSQTLYEFRSSNPKALNTLEGSGVFETYKLTTNYRSNQEILDFANVALRNIEANRFAGIQLRSNLLTPPTAQSLLEKVNLNYRAFGTQKEFKQSFPGIFRTEVKEYIDECLKRGQSVAFLARARAVGSEMEEMLKTLYPTRTVSNLTSERPYATTIFSEYIKRHWNDAKQVPVHQATFAVTQQIINNISTLTNNSSPSAAQVTKVTEMIQNWWLKNSGTIKGWSDKTAKRLMTKDEFFDNLRQNLLDYEIQHNAIKQSMINQKNNERKANNLAMNADLIVSTIHGAKGLEFDNVVVLHKFDAQMAEADKRMYYVAFTRAMKTEYILSYGTVKNAQIESDYEQLHDALEKRDQKAAIVAAGGNPNLAGVVNDD